MAKHGLGTMVAIVATGLADAFWVIFGDRGAVLFASSAVFLLPNMMFTLLRRRSVKMEQSEKSVGKSARVLNCWSPAYSM